MEKQNISWKNSFIFAALAVSALLFFICNFFTVSAAETEDAGGAEETTEKTLLQCSDDWIIFQYLDDTGNPMFDVRYLDKTATELEEDGLVLQYRTIYQNDAEFELVKSSWNDLDFVVSEETKSEIENHKREYYIQFRIVSTDDKEVTISKSYTLLIYPQEEPFPYIVSASIDHYETYDLATQPYELHITLKYNDRFIISDFFGADFTSKYVAYLFSGGHIYQDNPSFKNGSEEVTIDGKAYSLPYSEFSFDLGLPTNQWIKQETLNVNFVYEIQGLTGSYTKNSPANFMLNLNVPPVPYTDVEEISITSSSSSIKPGNSIALTATVLPKDADDTSVSWYSSNEAYATVDEDGVVTAKVAGAGKYVTITAEANDGSGVEGTYTLYIEKIPAGSIKVSSIKLSADKTTVPAGGKVTVKAKVTPSNATNPAVAWKSSNTKYATVSTKGIVTTKAAGAGKTVTITATAKDGSGKKASIKIKIAKVKVNSIKLSAGSKTVKAGKKITVKAKILPTNATIKAVTWKSSNKKYATVSSKGVVTAKKAGKGKTVTITAEARDGSGKKAAIKIKIK